jgi:hypothetical protein
MPVDVPCTRPKPVSYRTKGCHATWYQRDDPCSSVWLSHHETNACDEPLTKPGMQTTVKLLAAQSEHLLLLRLRL